MSQRGHEKQKQSPLEQAYVADVYAACRTIQGCSDVLTRGLLAIHRKASAVQDRPQADVRASFVDAVKYFSAQHGPTDSVFVDKEVDFQRRQGHHRYNDSASTIPSFTPGEIPELTEPPRERQSSDAPLVKPLASLNLNSTVSPITPRSLPLSDQANGANENSPSFQKTTSKRPPMLRISPSKSGLSPSEDLALAVPHSSTTGNAARHSTFGSPATPCSRMQPAIAVVPQSPMSPSALSLPTPSNRAYGSPSTPDYSKETAGYKGHHARPHTPHNCALFEAQQTDSGRISSRHASADMPHDNSTVTVSVSQTFAGPPSPGGKITHVTTRHYKLSPRQAACVKDRKERRGVRSPSPHPLASPHRTSLSPTTMNSARAWLQSPGGAKTDHPKQFLLRNSPADADREAHVKVPVSDTSGAAKPDAAPGRPPPSPLGNSEKLFPLGKSERRPLMNYSRTHGSVQGTLPSMASKQGEVRGRKAAAQPAAQPLVYSHCEGKAEAPPTSEPASGRVGRRSVLSWGRASQVVRQSVVGHSTAVDDAFHLKTVSPLAESASRMSTGGSLETGK